MGLCVCHDYLGKTAQMHPASGSVCITFINQTGNSTGLFKKWKKKQPNDQIYTLYWYWTLFLDGEVSSVVLADLARLFITKYDHNWILKMHRRNDNTRCEWFSFVDHPRLMLILSLNRAFLFSIYTSDILANLTWQPQTIRLPTMMSDHFRERTEKGDSLFY